MSINASNNKVPESTPTSSIDKNSSSPSTSDHAEFGKLDTLVLIHILKDITTSESATSVAQIAKIMGEYLGQNYSRKTLNRKIQMLYQMQDAWKEAPEGSEERRKKRNISQIMYATFGGRIEARACDTVLKRGHAKSVEKEQQRYYFKPILQESAKDMLKGTIYSNAFLSEEEKKYLLDRIKILNYKNEDVILEEDEGTSFSVIDNTDYDDYEVFPGEANRFIRNITILNEAIARELQIEMTYGTYDCIDDQLDYHCRPSNDQPTVYRLNPYALHWSGGHYYLIATYAKNYAPSYITNPDSPINFRIDRIIDVTFGRENPKFNIKNFPNGLQEETAITGNIPSRLKQFFDNDDLTFNSIEYNRHFPMMRISRKEQLIDLEIECTSWSLQVIVDAFGSTFEVKESPCNHTEDELDYNGRPQSFIVATLKDVEYENARDFCLANPQYIRPVGPRHLVNEVKEILTEAVKRLS